MSDLGECCYGMGFGPEGDGVELKAAPAGFNDDVGDYWSQPGIGILTPGSFENIQWPQWAFDDRPESNAKPSLPTLTRQAGEKYKGLGFCDGMDQ